jgi:hypothetical protein
MEPLDTGITPGKLKLTFADGTQAIFKPARGEAGKKPKD